MTSQVGRDGEDRAAARPRAPARQGPARESRLSASIRAPLESPFLPPQVSRRGGRGWRPGEGTQEGISSGARGFAQVVSSYLPGHRSVLGAEFFWFDGGQESSLDSSLPVRSSVIFPVILASREERAGSF